MRSEQIVYGIHPILEMLHSGRAISRLYVALQRDDATAGQIAILAKQQRIALQLVHKEALSRMTGTTKHQGVAAMIAPKKYHDLAELLSIAEVRKEPPFLLLLDCVEDPRNLGAIFRVAEGAGVHGVIFPKQRAAGLSPAVSKASAGADAHLPLAHVTNLGQAIDQLKKEAILIVGLCADAPQSYWQADFTGGIAIVAGGEENGMHQKIRERCDQMVALPMRGIIESLNVSVAVGIVAYEVLRQRERQHLKSSSF